MANVRKYGYTKPAKINNPIRWTPKMPKGNKQKSPAAYARKGT